MEKINKGWAIINIGHPKTGTASVFSGSFRYTRRECVADFISGSGQTWKYWRNKFNFRCVKAEETLKTLEDGK